MLIRINETFDVVFLLLFLRIFKRLTQTYELHCAVCMDTLHDNTRNMKKNVNKSRNKCANLFKQNNERQQKKMKQTNVYLRLIQGENKMIKTENRM